MRRQEMEIMEDIQKILNNQDTLLKKPKSAQEELLQIYGQRYLLQKDMLHKRIQEVLTYLPGTFGSTALKIAYISLCLQSKIELPPADYPLLKMLIDWSQAFPSFKALGQFNLTDIVVQQDQVAHFNCFEEYIVYIDLIGVDIINLVRRSKNDGLDDPLNIMVSQKKRSFEHISPEDLLMFVNFSLPKILINVLLTNQVIPPEFQRQTQNLECLYKDASAQYFVRTKQRYAEVIKILLKILLTMQFKPNLQILLMDIVFRYFYAFHHDKKHQATQIFIHAYNKLGDTTRFALVEEFIVFFTVSRKIGKGKFIDFIIDKSDWLKQITSKTMDMNFLSKTRDTITPFNILGLAETILIEKGKTETRTLEVLEDFSLVYFRIQIPTHDITIRLFYLGEIHSEKQTNIVLIEKQKIAGEFSTNVMAVKRGLYRFEFDNSYSWMNNKTVKYQKVIFTPVQMQSLDRYKWIQAYYGNIASNQIANKDKIWVFKNPAPKVKANYVGVANMTKNGICYGIKVTKDDHQYEFQSENEDKFLQKFHQLIQRVGNVRWMIEGQPLEGLDTVKTFIANRQAQAQAKRSETIASIQRQKKRAQSQIGNASTIKQIEHQPETS